ncbi:Cdc6/Cdc18 family protein [Halomarina ordinaria]|uniref:Cdc6/Cdc18 family protein n=1 Tax=Halomarina ordinaria TaxID=3033939 RepID=A0ABD5UGU0_9EURY|nr:Cdc6/Cdc18 family protein [Halomarina sp. PSRA2]
MISDARVLHPEFVPRDVVHRDREIRGLSRALEPITHNEPVETAFLFGPSGAGKTCIAQHTVERLRETVLDLTYQYVNCWEDYTRYKALYRVVEGVAPSFDMHRQSTPTDALIERLREYDGPGCVVILDEADQLEDMGVLYDLYRTRGLSMILIANREEELFAHLDERLASRLRTTARIRFDHYTEDELVAILSDRARWGFHDGAVEQEHLEEIADAAGGDARTAIGILRNAARLATQSGVDSMTAEHIGDAVPEAESEIAQKDIEKLTPDQRALYDIICEYDEIAPGDLYREYRERVEEPKSDRMVRNYLSKMQHYNLISARGENRGRTYRTR